MAEKIPIESIEGLQAYLDSIGLPAPNPTGALLKSGMSCLPELV